VLLKIQINSKKPGFGRKNQLEDVVTLGPPTAQATLVGNLFWSLGMVKQLAYEYGL
jgi:hypothetical protein